MAQNSENKQIDNEVYNPICYINVKLATIDSPKFRASVNYFEDQLNEFIKLLDGLTKLIELYTKEYMSKLRDIPLFYYILFFFFFFF